MRRRYWLRQAHAALDTAVATACGWAGCAGWAPAIADDEMLRRLPALSLAWRMT